MGITPEMVRARSIFIFILLSLFATFSLPAQNKYAINECEEDAARRHAVGDRLKIVVPKAAKLIRAGTLITLPTTLVLV